MSVGYDHIDIAACQRHGVQVTNTPGVLTNSTVGSTGVIFPPLCSDYVESAACTNHVPLVYSISVAALLLSLHLVTMLTLFRRI